MLGSNDGNCTLARMRPVAGSIATTAPFLPRSPLNAARWARASIVVLTAPPAGSRPAKSCSARSTTNSDDRPVRMRFSVRSSPVAPYTIE